MKADLSRLSDSVEKWEPLRLSKLRTSVAYNKESLALTGCSAERADASVCDDCLLGCRAVHSN
jgi:hypothetical protein